MDTNTRVLSSPSPDSSSGSETEGPPTPRASRSQPSGNNSDGVSSAEALASMNPRQRQALFGCGLCGPVANCSCVAARGYDNKMASEMQEVIREEEEKMFGDRDPQAVLDKREKKEFVEKFEELVLPDNKFSPICCGHGLTLVEREGSGEFLEDGRREPILKFMKSLETAGFTLAIDQYSEEELKEVKELFRVKRINDPNNKATFIYHPIINKENVKDHYATIFKIDPPHAFERFGGPTTKGKNGYLAFYCRHHKVTVHVGYSIFHYIGKMGTKATFGDGRLDKLMCVPGLEKLVLGYSGPGW